jgi:hypothetical protein
VKRVWRSQHNCKATSSAAPLPVTFVAGAANGGGCFLVCAAVAYFHVRAAAAFFLVCSTAAVVLVCTVTGSFVTWKFG